MLAGRKERAEIRLNRVEYVVLAVPIETLTQIDRRVDVHTEGRVEVYTTTIAYTCLLYTSDAADE